MLAKYPRAVVTLGSAYHYYNLSDDIPDCYHLATDRSFLEIREELCGAKMEDYLEKFPWRD